MPLQIIVTKKSVVKIMDGMWNISANLTCTDETGKEIINQDFTADWKRDEPPEPIIALMKDKMQAVIDDYKGEQAIFNDPVLDNAVIFMNSNLAG